MPRERPVTWAQVMSEIELCITKSAELLAVPRVPRAAREAALFINEHLTALLARDGKR